MESLSLGVSTERRYTSSSAEIVTRREERSISTMRDHLNLSSLLSCRSPREFKCTQRPVPLLEELFACNIVQEMEVRWGAALRQVLNRISHILSLCFQEAMCYC